MVKDCVRGGKSCTGKLLVILMHVYVAQPTPVGACMVGGIQVLRRLHIYTVIKTFLLVMIHIIALQ